MKEVRVSTEINALPSTIWSICIDTGRYREWNPYIREIAGKLEPNARVRVTMSLSAGRKPFVVVPRVTALCAPHHIQWKGHTFIPGLFDAEHNFIIEPTSSTSVQFIQKEQFTGILLPFLWPSLRILLHEQFQKMNDALKQRAETGKDST
jgi:hypothetical protein